MKPLHIWIFFWWKRTLGSIPSIWTTWDVSMISIDWFASRIPSSAFDFYDLLYDMRMRRGLSCTTITPRKVMPRAVLGAPGVVPSPLRRLTAMSLRYSIYRSLFLTIFSQIIGINVRNYGWFRAVKRIYLRNCVSLDVPRHPQYSPRPSEHNLTGYQRPNPVLNHQK